MGQRKRRKVNATGRNEGEGQYAPLSYQLLQSPAWRGMTGAGVKLYLEIRSRFNGANNGKISLSWDEAARLLHVGKATIQRAIAEIDTRGFAKMTKAGQWHGRQATLWRVTDRPCDGHLATHDWKAWRPPQKTEIGSIADQSPTATGSKQNRSAADRFYIEPVTRH